MRILETFLIILILIEQTSCNQSDRSMASQWIINAHQANLEADQAMARGDLKSVSRTLKPIVLAPVPTGISQEDRRVIQQDACFRLALSQLYTGNPQQALEWGQRGLSWGKHDDLFTANLYIAQGHAFDSLGKYDLAADRFHQALIINETLFNQALQEPKGRKKP